MLKVADRLGGVDPIARRIFQVSAVIMLLELICIRWIAAYVRLFGFFINFILLASLLGIGVGVLSSRQGGKYPLPFPVLLVALVSIVIKMQYSFSVPTSQMLF